MLQNLNMQTLANLNGSLINMYQQAGGPGGPAPGGPAAPGGCENYLQELYH